MDYLFRLADGRRLALWSERNQIFRQLSGEGGRSYVTLRTDFLSDFSAVNFDGRIYFVYRNTARNVMLYRPEERGDRLLFGESVESCRHSGLTLAVWESELYLLYTVWNPIREKYSLRMQKPLDMLEQSGRSEEETGMPVLEESDTRPEFRVVEAENTLLIVSGGACWRLCRDSEKKDVWTYGVWSDEEACESTLAESVAMERDEWKAHADSLERERDEWKAQADSSERERNEWKAQAESLKQERDEWKKRTDSLEQEHDEWSAQANDLKQECNEWKARSNRSEQACNDWKSQAEDARKECDEIKKQAQNLIQENAACRQQLTEYQTKLQSVAAQYNELAELARQLQNEGKRWREKYYHKAHEN